MVKQYTGNYGDAPIEDKYVAKMVAVAHALDLEFNGRAGGPDRATGFVLLVFPYGEGKGRCNYISNGASREDMIKLLREQANRFEEDLRRNQQRG